MWGCFFREQTGSSLPEVDLGVTGQEGPDLDQDVQAAPSVGHFILCRQRTRHYMDEASRCDPAKILLCKKKKAQTEC